jgi:hypothetical protein
MKKIIILLGILGLTSISHAIECKGITIQNGYITYLEDVSLKVDETQFELKIGPICGQYYHGWVEVKETMTNYQYFELFSIKSRRHDSFLGGFTLRNDGSAYFNMDRGLIYNFICKPESTTETPVSTREACLSACEELRSGWGYQACRSSCN